MPKYLVQVSYTLEGLRGLINDTATHRAQVGKIAAQSVGGDIEETYWAFGDYDLVVIADFPDNVSASAFGMQLTAAGAVRTKTTPLMTAAEVDRAIRKRVKYTPPGAGKKKK
jgi:uncharacterized protein with GYD domain